ncbi:MAG: Holliday junction resolvase RuvX [Pseudomonadota bacterium]
MDKQVTVIGFDVGLKRTGAAIGSTNSGKAQPVGKLDVVRGQHDWQAIDQLLQEWQPALAIIGSGSKHDAALSKAINRLVHHLQSHKIKVKKVDETLSTAQANSELSDISTAGNKTELRDQIAACLILESYLNELS